MLYGAKDGGTYRGLSLNPYFFGKCSTAEECIANVTGYKSLNPYFFGKCSTAGNCFDPKVGEVVES